MVGRDFGSVGAVLAFLSCALLASSPAVAASYRIVEGSVRDALSGESHALTGGFEASLFESDPSVETPITTLRIDDFALQSDGRAFSPHGPLAFGEFTSFSLIEIANTIRLDGDSIEFFYLRTRGEIVDSTENSVTFRFLDFRSGNLKHPRGHAEGHLRGSLLPRRVTVEGSLYEVDVTFDLPEESCPQPGDGGGGIEIGDGGGIDIGGGGGVVIGGGGIVIEVEGSGNLIHHFQVFDIEQPEVVLFEPPSGGAAIISRVRGGGASSLDGELHAAAEVQILTPTAIVFGSSPTLEELGIEAPAGAEVALSVDGALVVSSEGDLFVDWEILARYPGLTSVHLTTPTRIEITGDLSAEFDVTIEAGEAVVIEDGGSIPPGDIEIEPGPRICVGLPLVRFPSEEDREIGTFTLVASAGRPVDIDVKPHRERNRVRPGRRGRLTVAILGTEDFDVRDVDVRSLRLGRGEAEAKHRRTQRRDVNGDGHADLRLRFNVRDTEIAYGDTTLCLVGDTKDGAPIEGCDKIETRPVRKKRDRH